MRTARVAGSSRISKTTPVLTAGSNADGWRLTLPLCRRVCNLVVPIQLPIQCGLDEYQSVSFSHVLSPLLEAFWVAAKRGEKHLQGIERDEPDVQFGNMLLEQFGGANGELAAAMQYSIQGINCEDPDRKDLLMDIGTEELSHLEVVGCLARMHLKSSKFDRRAAEADPLIASRAAAASISLTRKATHGRPITSKLPGNWMSICAAT
jgi:hypothetical protein